MIVPHSNNTGAVAPWEYLPAAAGTYQVGQALNISGGELTAISAPCTTTPQYLCMADITAAAGDIVPVIRIDKDTIYETILSTQATDATIGTMLEVTSGGLEVDGTAAGTFEVVYIGGTAAGDMVRGRFT